MRRKFELLFFDLGDTLIYDRDPWPPILKEADSALRRSLAEAGHELPADAYRGFDTIFDLYYHQRRDSDLEPTTSQLLTELLHDQGLHPPEPVLRAAVRALYAVTQDNWHVEPGAATTLKKLKEHGYRLAVISNASDDENVQALVDKAGLREFLELTLSSAACGIRKPHPRIFRTAIDHFGVHPERTAMIGDTLEADVLGANRMGMYSIWITRRAPGPPEGELNVQPDAVISKLGDLPGLLADIEKGSPDELETA